MLHLQPNTTLQGGKYRIERVLGQGGFGNTYVGYNTEFEETVAIKEFFMKGVTERDETTCVVSVSNADNVQQFEEQREKFKKEALRIRKLDNPHIVKVHDLFEENGTAYYVMDFVEGENLSQRLKRTGKPMAERKVREIFLQLLEALKAVHDAGMWHLDIKPANIMLNKNGNVKLIDFGASKQLNAQKGGATTSTAISYTNGYAPREQMEQNYDKFGPWTDIYALGATLYSLLTNKRPPMPSDIDDDISEDKHNALPFSATTSNEMKQLVVQMMQTNRMKRPQSINEIVISGKTHKHTHKKQIAEHKSEDADEMGEETIIIPKEDIANPQEKKEETTKQEADLSYLDDMEETWKDKLWSYLTDLKHIGLIFAVICGLGIVRQFVVTCLSGTYNAKKEYSKLLEDSRNPDLSEEETKIIFNQLESLAEKEYGPAIYMLGSFFIDKDSLKAMELFDQSLPLLSKEAVDGDLYAQYALGCCYYSGIVVSQNFKEAYQWFNKSAQQGLPEAMQSLALCYIRGDGVQADYEEGIKWQYKAAESNVPSILYTTGVICEQFAGDSIKALNYYKKAAELGNEEACLHVGADYKDGILAKQDYAKALEYYTKAAEKGNPIAYINIGTIYLLSYCNYTYDGKDLGVEKDIKKAIHNIESALNIVENVDAHYWLGLCYWYAKDENKDDTKAFNHIKIAAEGNHPAAQMQLYFFYCHGIGVEPNQKLAQMWRKRAIENGYEEE
jgi:serine/threonine-protein kinase